MLQKELTVCSSLKHLLRKLAITNLFPASSRFKSSTTHKCFLQILEATSEMQTPGRYSCLPVSVGEQDPNFYECLAPICKTTSSPKDMRRLFLLQKTSINKPREPNHQPNPPWTSLLPFLKQSQVSKAFLLFWQNWVKVTLQSPSPTAVSLSKICLTAFN